MSRPRGRRFIGFNPRVRYFKPQGIPLRELSVVELTAEEVEAFYLRHVHGLQQVDAAGRMRTSQSTYQRILQSAYTKLADAVVNGKAIRILTP